MARNGLKVICDFAHIMRVKLLDLRELESHCRTTEFPTPNNPSPKPRVERDRLALGKRYSSPETDSPRDQPKYVVPRSIRHEGRMSRYSFTSALLLQTAGHTACIGCGKKLTLKNYFQTIRRLRCLRHLSLRRSHRCASFPPIEHQLLLLLQCSLS